MNADRLTIDVPLEQVLTTLAPHIEAQVTKRMHAIDSAILAVARAADRVENSKHTRDERASISALVSASLDLKRTRAALVKALKLEGRTQ
jgi:hypothetical protein